MIHNLEDKTARELREIIEIQMEEYRELLKRTEVIKRERDELEHKLNLTVLTTHQATLDSEYGKEWKNKFAIEQKMSILSAVETTFNAHENGGEPISFYGAFLIVKEQLRQQLNKGE